MKILAVAAMLALSLASSCNTKPETAAVRTLAASKGFIESEMSQHGDCKPGATATTSPAQLCTLLNQAINAQHVAVLSLDAYCSSTDYLSNGGVCSPPTQANLKADAQAKLTTAVGNLEGIINSIKSISKGGN